jgi:Flp pilus assembly protein TadD
MQKNIKRIFQGGFAVAITVAAFTLGTNDSSLGSLRAKAKIADGGGEYKCTAAQNCDCKSPSTGTVYCGKKLVEMN